MSACAFLNIPQEMAADGYPAGVEREEEDLWLQPFDPEAIHVNTRVVPMDTIIRRVLKGTINLAPPFQRKKVWGKIQKSRLIESLMLKIPIPMFYVASDRMERWDVVDGLQRLTTICEFLFGTADRNSIVHKANYQYESGFMLEGLEFWGESCNGKRFNQLPDFLQARIIESAFTFTVIEPGTPETVKRTIFKRINTGGLPLSAQEIRHALYHGAATDLLASLEENKAYRSATSSSVDDSRMSGRELILRMLSFTLTPYQEYPASGDMDLFLSDTMRYLNSNRSIVANYERAPLKEYFEIGMLRAAEVFGKHAFRRSFGRARRSPINKSLFEVWGNSLASLSERAYGNLLVRRAEFLEAYSHYLDDPAIADAISKNSWSKRSVTFRFASAGAIMEQFK